MQLIDVTGIVPTGLPLYEKRDIFHLEGAFSQADISLIHILPGQRVPETGTSTHTLDEYSYFISGELYTESGEFTGMVSTGQATLIPKGEAHWCENRTDQPCVIACIMVK